MRSAVVIGAALAVLTVRLLSDTGAREAPPTASARAASAAAALLAATASAPVGGAAGAADTPLTAGGAASVAGAPPAAADSTGATVASGPPASARRAMSAALAEEEMRAKRRQGESEDAIYRARAARLPQADVTQLVEREAVEADWAHRLEACRAGHCDPAPVDQRVNVAAYQRAAIPSLTLE